MEDTKGTYPDKESLLREEERETVSSLHANSLPVCEFKSNFVGKKVLKQKERLPSATDYSYTIKKRVAFLARDQQ